MDRQSAKTTISAIQALLNAYDMENASLNKLKEQLDTLPDTKTVDTYNDLVTKYQRARGYQNFMEAAENLVAYYSKHAEELSQKHDEIAKLQEVIDTNKEMHRLYEKLESELN